jgi:apolipoprotein N-acyltransferase
MPQASSTAVPRIIRRTVTQFEWRHVKGVAVIRALVALWLVALGSIAFAEGYWWGAFLYVVAGLVGWLAYRMPRWKLALDAESGLAGAERDEAG